MTGKAALCLLLIGIGTGSWAQTVEAISEDSTRRVTFRLNQGVECELNVPQQPPILVRGKLMRVDSTSFRLELGAGYYTTVMMDNLIRMRRRHYTRQRLATAGSGTSLLSSGTLQSKSIGSALVVATSALTGLGLALARERASFRHRDPSAYQGWTFQTHP